MWVFRSLLKTVACLHHKLYVGGMSASQIACGRLPQQWRHKCKTAHQNLGRQCVACWAGCYRSSVGHVLGGMAWWGLAGTLDHPSVWPGTSGWVCWSGSSDILGASGLFGFAFWCPWSHMQQHSACAAACWWWCLGVHGGVSAIVQLTQHKGIHRFLCHLPGDYPVYGADVPVCRETNFLEYKFWHNKVVRMIRKAKTDFYANAIESKGRNPAISWKPLKEVWPGKQQLYPNIL